MALADVVGAELEEPGRGRPAPLRSAEVAEAEALAEQGVPVGREDGQRLLVVFEAALDLLHLEGDLGQGDEHGQRFGDLVVDREVVPLGREELSAKKGDLAEIVVDLENSGSRARSASSRSGSRRRGDGRLEGRQPGIGMKVRVGPRCELVLELVEEGGPQGQAQGGRQVVGRGARSISLSRSGTLARPSRAGPRKSGRGPVDPGLPLTLFGNPARSSSHGA